MFSDFFSRCRLGLVAISLACGLAGSALAQTGGNPNNPDLPPPPPQPPTIHESLPGVLPVFIPPAEELLRQQKAPLDDAVASTVADSIRYAGAFCQAMPSSYRVDCLSERLGAIAATVPRSEGGDEVRKVLADASAKIGKIARDNRDAGKPRVRASTSGPTPVQTTRPIVAVRPEAEAAAMAEAAAVLEEAGALLLRSSAQSQVYAAQFQTIAEALDSTALLLRS